MIANRNVGFNNSQILNLIVALVIRDLRGRYTRSFLGPLWAIMQPLMLMIVFTLLSGVLDISTGETPYVVFSYVALVPWTFFQSATRGSGGSIYGGASILKKIAVPREIFPVIAVITAAFDMLMSGIVLVLMLIFFGVTFTVNILWVPVLVLLTGLLAWGLGLGIAGLGTYRRDFIMGLGFALQLLTYATPIIYPLSDVPEQWLPYYRLNPLVGLIENYRAVIIDGTPPDFQLLLISLIATLAIC
ncbi:MAG: ABC transporter permease, partial [Chloroflexota bacterium]